MIIALAREVFVVIAESLERQSFPNAR